VDGDAAVTVAGRREARGGAGIGWTGAGAGGIGARSASGGATTAGGLENARSALERFRYVETSTHPVASA